MMNILALVLKKTFKITNLTVEFVAKVLDFGVHKRNKSNQSKIGKRNVEGK